MSFRSKADRIRSNRNGQLALGQRAGNTGDARARRGIEAELNAGQRIGRGVEVDRNGRQQVRTDATIHIDRRNRHSVVPDSLRFATPVEGSQAATKDYVDTAVGDIVIIGDSEYVVEYNRPATGPSISTTTSWKPAPPGELYAHNNIVSPSNPAAVYATITHTGTGDECVYLYPGYVYGIALSLRCYQSAFELGLLYSATIGAAAWNVDSPSIRFTETGDTSTVYLLLDNTAGAYTYVTPAFRRYQSGTAIVSTVRMHARRLHPHYEGGYPALPLPGLPDAPEAGFEAESATLLAFRDELLSNLSTGNVTSVVWDFGDRYTPGVALHGSTERNPVYRYEAGGTLPVSITATGDGGSDTYTANVTVQDVVCTENLLNSAGVFDLSDFPTTVKMASVGASPIAAPDGTMTAIRCIGDLTGEATTLAVLNNSSSPIDFTGQWSDAVAWTYSFYVYRPSIESGGTNYGKFQFSLLGASGYNNYIQWRCTATNPLYSVAAVTPSTSSFAYSAERSIAVEEVGNSGWTKYTVTLVDTEQNISNIQLQMQHRGGDHYLDTWSPELRYGDWVARGKNWGASDPRDFAVTPDTALSSIVAPDGTLSAVDITYTSSPYQGIWREDITDIPGSGLYVWSFYIRETDYATGTAGLNENRLNLRVHLYVGTTRVVDRRSDLNLLSGSVALDSPANFTVANIEAVGSDGWHKVTVGYSYDGSSGAISWAEFGIYHPYLPNPTQTHTIWNPRLTVGNPADWETVLPFVSGPQNLLGDGSNYDPATSIWSTGAAPRDVAVTTNTAVAPNGRLEADTLTHTDGQSPYDYLFQSVSKSAATEAVYYNFYYKIDTALPTGTACEYVVFGLQVGGTILEQIGAFLAYGSDDPVVIVIGTTTGGPGYTADDITVTAVSNDWVRVSIRLFDYSGTGTNPRIWHYNQTPLGTRADYDVTLWGSEVTTIDPLDPV